jgi:CBS domain-containing protein
MATSEPSPRVGFFATTGGSGFPQANVPSSFLVKDVMSFDLEWINSGETAFVAAQKMLQRNIGALPVKDSTSGLLSGIITDRDIIVRVLGMGLDPQITKISSVMTPSPLATIYDNENVMDAERLMLMREVRRLIVARRDDDLVIGVLSVDDLAMSGFRSRAGEIVRGAAATPTGSSGPSWTVVGAADEVTLTTTQSFAKVEYPSIYSVDDVMHRPVEYIVDSDTCRQAAIKMMTRNIGCLLVCSDPAQTPILLRGVVTDRDLVLRVIAAGFNPDATRAGDVMTKNVACCFSDDNLADAQRLMMTRAVRRLPVLRRDTSEFIGLVSIDDIALYASRKRVGSVLENVSTLPRERASAAAPAGQA